MNMKILFLSGIFCLMASFVFAQDNPLKVETYQLKNGLTVYLNIDHTMPMVHGMVTVKGGGKRDPKDATGIAHYFEHIMFKGTDQIGTIGYAEEKPYLDSIRALYDDLGKTKDEKKRLEIQKEINRISLKAANYAIPNEFDKILNEMGGKNINAGTGEEMISYYNSFPSNQIDKWIDVYSHRFINPVFRLFQSELETVYEEKNMYADDLMQGMFEKFSAQFYKNSPYGQQTIIGTTEHLKNPSLSKMEEYFNTFYVAKNMALILSGDIDPVKIKPLLEEKFGAWRSGEKPKDLVLNEAPFKGKEVMKKRMTPIKVGLRGYRTIPRNHPDEIAFDICANLLSNSSSTGLLDQLRTDNKLLFAGMMNNNYTEIGGSYIFFVPKIVGQSLKRAEKNLEIQMDILLKGEFDDELLAAVKIEMKKQHEKSLEDMRSRTYAISDAFVHGVDWNEFLKTPEKIDKVTKEDIVKIANKYFGDNYLAFYSKMGFPKKDKIKKPPFKPVQPVNSDKKSDYAKKVEEMPIVEMNPKFIDFGKDVVITDIEKGVKAFITPNPINQVFSIALVFGKGDFQDPMVDKAAAMFGQASPTGMKFEEFKRKLQLLGCNLSAYAGLNSTTLNISGLEENLEASLKLINQFLKDISIEEKQLKKLAQDNKMELKYENKDISTIGDAVSQYALYGKNSSYLTRLSQKQIKDLSISTVLAKMKEIISYEYEVHYCGTKSADEFKNIFKQNIEIGSNLKPKNNVVEPERIARKENTILFLDDKKAIQSHIYFLVEGAVNNEQSLVEMEAFNDYLGGSMASIIFQEIREFRSLAYGSSGRYQASFYRDKPGYFKGWLSTQADKTNEAIEAYTQILSNMPEKPERIESIRKDLSLSINANQPMLRYKSMSVSKWLDQGYKDDPRKDRYAKYLSVNFDEILDFYNKNLKGRHWTIAIAGDKKRIDLEKLKKYGTVKIVKKEDLFTK
jgi:zinc protease